MMLARGTGSGIGQPVRRKEDLRLVRGLGRYSDDMNLPGQAYAIMVRSPHAHARVLSIRTEEALKVPGVLAAFTYADVATEKFRPIPHATWSKHPAEIVLQNRGGVPPFMPPHFLMAVNDEVHHVGEIVAIAVADSVDAAKDGAEAVVVEYEPLAAVARAIDAADPSSPLSRLSGPSNVSIDADVGNREATDLAFAKAAHVVSLKTWVPRVSGVPMEPRAAIGDYDAQSGVYTLYAGIGGAIRPRNDLAAIFRVPEDKVRVVMHDVGGNFGTRGAFNPEFGLVTWAARKLGRPVKWTSGRHEFFIGDYQARDLHSEAELALDEDGSLLAMRGSNVVNIGAYPVAYGPLQKGIEIASSIYHVPTAFFRGRGVMTNTVPTRAYRSAGRPEVMFVMERLLDLAARQCGFDRLELRRRNLVPESAMPYTNPFGLVYDSGAYHTVMERALELGDWSGFEARRAEALRRGKYRGIGVANYVDTATGAPREKAEITVLPDGIVEVVIGTVSQGQGHETSFAQLMHEWLGVSLDSVRLVTGDTARVSVGGGAHSGRALRMGSVVMFKASQEIIAKALRIAGSLLEVDASDLAFEAGTFQVKGTDRGIDLFDVAAAAAAHDGAIPQDLRGPLRAESDEMNLVPSFPYGCHVCEVEIDPETGVSTIVQYTAIDDCGRAVNPMIVHGQVHGGIAQGVGEALMEECVYDPDSVQPLTGSFMDYAMPRAHMLPGYVTELSEVPCPTHPLGLRPGGEGGTTPALAVVINAVVDALAPLGVRHLDMPATPHRVWAAIRDATQAEPKSE
jgi:carbon-monoxide dehydrogenase large subunit